MSKSDRLNKSQELVESHEGKWPFFCQMTLHPTILNFWEMYITLTVNWLVLFMSSGIKLTGQQILQAVLKNPYRAAFKISGECELPNIWF